MTLTELLAGLHAGRYDFEDIQSYIRNHYDYTPTAFRNGSVSNDAGQNEGSCRLFAFARLEGLSEADTLVCFGRHYRDVLAEPQGSSHGNIRQFMQHGWEGIAFSGEALQRRDA